MKVELEIPPEYEKEIRKLTKNINWKEFIPRALARGVKEELELEMKFRTVKKILRKSRLTEKDIKILSENVKKNAAKKLGLV